MVQAKFWLCIIPTSLEWILVIKNKKEKEKEKEKKEDHYGNAI